jgi:hypothetical protein
LDCSQVRQCRELIQKRILKRKRAAAAASKAAVKKTGPDNDFISWRPFRYSDGVYQRQQSGCGIEEMASGRF